MSLLWIKASSTSSSSSANKEERGFSMLAVRDPAKVLFDALHWPGPKESSCTVKDWYLHKMVLNYGENKLLAVVWLNAPIHEVITLCQCSFTFVWELINVWHPTDSVKQARFAGGRDRYLNVKIKSC